MSAQPSEMMALTPRTRESIARLSQPTLVPETVHRTPRHAHQARKTPATLPAVPSISDSVRNCRATRRRPAPSARRVATSRVRLVARASRRLVTFAHTIISTKPTPTASTIRNCASPPKSNSIGLRTSTPHPAFAAASTCSRRAATALNSLRACSVVAPGRRRPTTIAVRAERGAASGSLAGTTRSASSPENGERVKGFAITPTIVAGRPFTVMTRPATSAAPPYRRCHKACERRTARGAPAPGARSDAVKNRPTAGRASSSARSSSLTAPPLTASGSPPPLSVNVPGS